MKEIEATRTRLGAEIGELEGRLPAAVGLAKALGGGWSVSEL